MAARPRECGAGFLPQNHIYARGGGADSK
ncbi:hypothetical protein, partial [Vibrio phage VP16C]